MKLWAILCSHFYLGELPIETSPIWNHNNKVHAFFIVPLEPDFSRLNFAWQHPGLPWKRASQGLKGISGVCLWAGSLLTIGVVLSSLWELISISSKQRSGLRPVLKNLEVFSDLFEPLLISVLNNLGFQRKIQRQILIQSDNAGNAVSTRYWQWYQLDPCQGDRR